jgi:hypothetical protein
MIERIGHSIYARAREEGLENNVGLARYNDFIWVWQHKMLPLMKEYREAGSLRREMVKLEYKAPIIRQREAPCELDPDRRRLRDAVNLARDTLLDQIRERRIVIETNPASNLRISGANQLGKSPAVALLQQMRRGLLTCVNTDDPGVFGSRIENEYALLLQGLLEAGTQQGEARDLLERSRAVGMDLLHWPPRPPRPD